MRCIACNVELDDHEVTRKDPKTNQYLDTCGDCLKSIRDAVKELDDLPNEVFIKINLDDDEDTL